MPHTYLLTYSPTHLQVDATSDDLTARDVRWWRADELLGGIGHDQLLERMVVGRPGSSRGVASDAEIELTSFQKAVCKTMALENAHPLAHERWHATVMHTIAAAQQRKSSNARRSRELRSTMAAVASGGMASGGMASGGMLASRRSSKPTASRGSRYLRASMPTAVPPAVPPASVPPVSSSDPQWAAEAAWAAAAARAPPRLLLEPVPFSSERQPVRRTRTPAEQRHGRVVPRHDTGVPPTWSEPPPSQ